MWRAAAAAKLLRSCPTLWNPIDGSLPGFSIPGILQARTLEQVAISFSNACKWKEKVKSLSRVRLLVTPWTASHQVPSPMGFSRQEYCSGVPLPSPAKNWLTGKDLDARKDWRQEEKRATEGEMAGCHHRLDGQEFDLTPWDSGGERSLASAVHEITKSRTRLTGWTTTTRAWKHHRLRSTGSKVPEKQRERHKSATLGPNGFACEFPCSPRKASGVPHLSEKMLQELVITEDEHLSYESLAKL